MVMLLLGLRIRMVSYRGLVCWVFDTSIYIYPDGYGTKWSMDARLQSIKPMSVKSR